MLVNGEEIKLRILQQNHYLKSFNHVAAKINCGHTTVHLKAASRFTDTVVKSFLSLKLGLLYGAEDTSNHHQFIVDSI
jgi:hypothetical protein